MADASERHDRTEAPTQKRLDDARREGRIPRSRDLTAARA
jgi:flagellar biosynthesis protein FlhB